MTDPTSARPIDVSTPNAARMYDYYLGGKDNFAADRLAAEAVLGVVPHVRDAARVGRVHLGYAVRHLVESGIRQIVDLGSGLPTRENVHEIAHAVDPSTRVVYVDHDPVVVAHGQALLAEPGHVAMVRGDLLRPDEILDHPDLRRLIDLDRPVALLMMFMLHLVPDDARPHDVVARYREAIVPGSALSISHASSDVQVELMAHIAEVYRGVGTPFVPRTRAEILRFFGDFELVPPGLVNVWPHSTPPEGFDPVLATLGWSGVGIKRG